MLSISLSLSEYAMSKILFYTCTLIALLTAATAQAMDCKDVKYVDEQNGYEEALYSALGCQPLTRELIQRFRKSKMELVVHYYTDRYLQTPQPKKVPEQEYVRILEASLKNREIFSILYAHDWDEYFPNELLTELTPEYFSKSDTTQRSLALALISSESIYSDKESVWKISEFDAISALMNNQTIPYIADYLSYAYSTGVGVTKNFNEVERLSSYASNTLPEAKRYLAMNIIDFDFVNGLSLLEEAIEVGYISAYEDYYDVLKQMVDTVPEAYPKVIALIPVLETLGYSGDSAAQRILGEIYSEGVFVGYNENRAISWYEKAAEQGNLASADYLVKHYAQLGDFKNSAKLLSLSAMKGYVWNHGYFDLMHMITLSQASWPDAKKLLEYIKYHCINNEQVSDEDKDVCISYPVNDAAFEDGITLKTAIADSTKLKYLDELKLPTGNYHALLIGNQEYSDWEPLKTPVKDIDEIASVLRADYAFDVTKLTNASRNEILREIYKLGERAEFNDHVLVYYAGHGLLDERTNEGYWIPVNADTSFRPDWVSNSEIKTALKSINSRHLLVMADSCYSGTLLRAGSAVDANMPNSVLERLFLKKAKIAITSGGNEPVADSVADGDTSLFAEAFTNALVQNSGTFVSASQVFSEIRDKVTKDTNQTPQYANMRELDDDGGEFVFKKVN